MPPGQLNDEKGTSRSRGGETCQPEERGRGRSEERKKKKGGGGWEDERERLLKKGQASLFPPAWIVLH